MKSKKLLKVFRGIDLFGESVNFTIDGGTTYNSVCGAMASLLVLFVIMVQLQEKFAVVLNRGDTSYSTRVEALSEANMVLTHENSQFNFAFGVTRGVEDKVRKKGDIDLFRFINIALMKLDFEADED